MKSRVFVVSAVVLLTSLSIASPARAQNYYEIDLGRAAVAVWENPKAQSFAFAVAGQGMIYNSEAGEPFFGEVGCAAVDSPKETAFGCGELSSFSIDDDLGAATGKGTFNAMIFDHDSDNVTKKGKISFSATWKATEEPAPRGSGGFFFDGPSVGMGIGAEIGRFASVGKKSRITGSPIGRGPGNAVYAEILAGPSISFEISG